MLQQRSTHPRVVITTKVPGALGQAHGRRSSLSPSGPLAPSARAASSTPSAALSRRWPTVTALFATCRSGLIRYYKDYTVYVYTLRFVTFTLQVAKAAKGLQCSHRLLLSGTPIQNDALEMWSLFDFLMPGYLGEQVHANIRPSGQPYVCIGFTRVCACIHACMYVRQVNPNPRLTRCMFGLTNIGLIGVNPLTLRIFYVGIPG